MTSFSEGQLLQLDTMLHLLDERTSLDTDLEQAWLQLRSSLEQNNTPFSQIASAHLSDQELVGFWSTLLDTAPELVNPQHLSDAIAEDMVTHLKDKVDAYRFTDPQQSATFAQQIIRIAIIRDDLSQLGLGYMAYGDSLQRMGRIWDAWEQLQKAEQYFEQAGDEIGWARLRISLLGLSIQLDGEYSEKLLADVERAEEIFIQHNMEDKLLRLMMNTGVVLGRLGRHREAIEHFENALTLATTATKVDEWLIGALHQNISLNLLRLGEVQNAVHHHKVAFESYLERKQWDGVAASRLNIVEIAITQGRYLYALKGIHQVLNTPEVSGTVHELVALQHMVECYLELNRIDDAFELATEIGPAFQSRGFSIEFGQNLIHLAIIHSKRRQWNQARKLIKQASHTFNTMGIQWLAANGDLRLVEIALEQGDIDLAQKTILLAYAYFYEKQSVIQLAYTKILQTKLDHIHGTLDHLEADIASIIEVANAEQVPSLTYSAHLLWGQIVEPENPKLAAKHYHIAMSIVDDMLQNMTITIRPDFLQNDYLSVYHALMRLSLQQKNAEEAFKALERLKGQIFLAYIINRDGLRWKQDQHSQQQKQLLDELRAEYHWVMNDDKTDKKPKKLNGLQKQIRAVTEQLFLHSAEPTTIESVTTPTLAEIQNHLTSEETLIEFYMDDEVVWCLVIQPDDIHIRQLCTVTTLQPYLRQLDINLNAAMQHFPLSGTSSALTQQFRQISQGIYKVLFDPVEEFLLGCSRIIVVPFGILHSLPFATLSSQQHTYLVESYEIQLLPSASMLARAHTSVGLPGAVVIGHSWNDKITARIEESQHIHQQFGGELFLEDAATRQTLAGPAHQILHIAAHGEFYLDHPDLSYILLDDGRIYMDDLLQHDLHYDLVTLSACETGKNHRVPSDELIGFGRGFLYAGARSLIASLWQVEDQWTSTLMQRMYAGLHEGQPKAAALANAQRSILMDEPTLHPFFWGAFQLVGDAGPLV